MLTHEVLTAAAAHPLRDVVLPALGPRRSGKVRDIYAPDSRHLVIVTTDRISAFDRVLGAVPFRGQVLNQLAAWWFERTRDIVANHVISVPDPNVLIARAAMPLPVEVIVRGYITGVTKTSLWTLYEAGDRTPYGISLPDGLRRNDALPEALITPTTKAEAGGSDERLTSAEVVSGGHVDAELWAQVEQVALALFARGQSIAAETGLILVDTKYEFGLVDGDLVVIDEVHTPDSSRYWTADSYAADPSSPVSLDKEAMREWFVAHGYRGDGTPPALPDEEAARIAARYINAYETLTGTPFVPAAQPAAERIAAVFAGGMPR